jgi:hypothetical protein
MEPNYVFASARLRREALSFVAGSPERATQAEMGTLRHLNV